MMPSMRFLTYSPPLRALRLPGAGKAPRLSPAIRPLRARHSWRWSISARALPGGTRDQDVGRPSEE